MNPSIPALPKRLPLWALGAICVAILAVPASAAATPGKMRVTPHPDGTNRGSERVVTIDVKDGEIASILREVATQCGIRNLVLDREVQGKGTFLFQDVPCEAAFRAIFSSMGLAADRELNSLIHVRTQR